MNVLLKLYFEFFKTGLFAIGGGMATFPFLQDIAQKTGWFTNSQLIDMIAISESTPGPIGVNSATYAGFHTYGVFGGIIATLGLITPSVLIILLVAKVLDAFKESLIVKKVFYGIRPASTAMIAAAGFSVVLSTLIDLTVITQPLKAINWFGIILAIALYYAINKWKKHPIVYILSSAVIGIAAGYLHLI